MKTNEFFDAMGKIDPALIERAERKVVKKSPIMKIAVIAASFAVLIAGAVAVLPMLIGGDAGFVQESVAWSDIIKMFSPGNSDGWSAGEINAENETVIEKSAFAEIVSGNYTDYIIGSVIPVGHNGSYIGEKLGEVEVRTGWLTHAEKKEKDVMIVKAEVYEIGGVSSKAAVAIRYLEKSATNSEYFSHYYYVAVNNNYELTTLSKFFADINAETYMSMSQYVLRVEVPDSANGEINIDKYQLEDEAGEKIRDLILSLDDSGVIMGYYDEAGVTVKKGAKVIEFSFMLQTSNRGIHHLFVFDNGNIAIESFGKDVAFFDVGVEATDALWTMFAEHAKLSTDKYTEDDLVEAVTEEVNE